jgi:SAM-dependent methyltransferase
MKIPIFANRLSQLVNRATNATMSEKKYCPICKKFSKTFEKYGQEKRVNAICLNCGSLERHRFTWLYFERKTNLFDGIPKKVLHIAPEKCFQKRLIRLLGDNYFSVDINAKRPMMRMDVTSIQFRDETFDVIYCSHVLEHVVNDKGAMLEFYRVLKSDGWAIVLVPINGQTTYEDPTITDPIKRSRLFGQEDHVRCYGLDYIDRLHDSGFEVKRICAVDFLSKEEILNMGITDAAGDIYFCKKKSECNIPQ